MRECSLCGGKLDRNKRCTLCGLDNTKNDRMYRDMMNRNNCDDVPMTHTHEEKGVDRRFRYEMPKGNNYKAESYRGTETPKKPTVKKQQKAAKPKKSGCATALGFIPIIIGLFAAISPIFEELEIGDGFIQEEEHYTSYEEYDPYEWVIDEMPEDGEYGYYVLEPGIYKIGYHIPMGNYNAAYDGEKYVNFEVQDSWNEISIYSFLDSDITEEDDLRLYDGGYFINQGPGNVILETKNAQPVVSCMENSATEEVVLDGTLYAGTDFVAGVYDVILQVEDPENYIFTSLMIDVEDYSYGISLEAMGEDGIYRNFPIPEGASVYLDHPEDMEGWKVVLMPAAAIATEDYYEFYDQVFW